MRPVRWSIRSNVIETGAATGVVRPILIVGIGNTLRRDDGAGWYFAEALAAALETAGRHVHLALHHQLTPELAIEAAELQPCAILFVDASVTVDEASFVPLPQMIAESASGHSLTPATLLTLMHRLYAVDVPGWLVQTPAADFGHGEGLSARAQRGLQAAPTLALRLFDHLPTLT